MARISGLAASEKPPDLVKHIYKHYQKLTPHALLIDTSILDFQRGLSHEQQKNTKCTDQVLQASIDTACSHLRQSIASERPSLNASVRIYEAENIPGKYPPYATSEVLFF